MRKHVELTSCTDTLQALALYERPDDDLSHVVSTLTFLRRVCMYQDGLGAACIDWETSGFLTNIQAPDPRVQRLGSRIVCTVIEVRTKCRS